MNNKAISFIKNFSYTLTSNFVSLIISTLVVLIVPKLIGVESYGYWQLYLFYSSYVGFLHFGWNDGIYLRYGGKDYKKLNKELFSSQFCMLFISQVIIAIIISVMSFLYFNDKNRIFIFQMVALCTILTNVRLMLLYILQITNRIKEYAQITMMDRVLYAFLISAFLLAGIRNFKLIVSADLIGKFISLLYAIYCCKDKIFCKISVFCFNFKEVKDNINAGMKLMFANIASMLIIGVVRFGIERSWDVKTFGKVSLTFSISNFMMLFIDAVGLIMFPIIKRTDKKKLPSIYATMRDFLMVVLLGALIVYYPFKIILSAWLPKYTDSLKYMALLFPMCIFEGKMSLLINTYLKALRKEKMMLKFNLITLIFSIIITFINTIVIKNLNLAIVSIVILLALRCLLAELFLSNILKILLYKDVILELIMTSIFILTGWFINSWFVIMLYAMAYILYLVIKKKDITNTIKNIRMLIKA